MQTVSDDFIAQANAGVDDPRAGVIVSWPKNISVSFSFMTINVSTIGGPDRIKGSGSDVTFLDKYDFTSESEHLISFSVEQEAGDRPWGIVMAQADVELDNTSRRFLPGFDSDIGDFIATRRPVKLSLGFQGELINQFSGFSDTPESTLIERKTEMHAMDGLEELLRFKSQTTLITDQMANEVMETLLQEAGLTSDQYEIDGSLNNEIGYIDPFDKPIGDIIEKLVEAEGGFLFMDEDGKVKFWNRQHMALNATARAKLHYRNMEDLQFVTTPIINDVIVRAKPREVKAEREVYFSESAIELEPGQTQEVFVPFTDDAGDELPVTTVQTPVHKDVDETSSYYDTNTESDGSGTTSSGNISLDDDDLLGTKYKLTFTNNGSVTMYITNIRIAGTPAEIREPIEHQEEDAASIVQYGRNPMNGGLPYEIENDLIQQPGEAITLASRLVAEYKDPHKRFRADPFAMPHLQFGDGVEVEVEDTNQTVTGFILGRTVSIAPMADLKMGLLIEARPVISFFTINVSLINGPDALAP